MYESICAVFQLMLAKVLVRKAVPNSKCNARKEEHSD